MNSQIFFIIIVVLILIFYIPSQNLNKSTQLVQPIQPTKPTQPTQPIQTLQQTQPSQPTQPAQQNKLILPMIENQQNQQNQSNKIIDEYLNETECKEKFETIDNSSSKENSLNNTNVDMGINMNFKQQIESNNSPLTKALKNSLVPDFQPNYLNINPDLNSYGYATTNPEADKYYKERGFINPKDGSKYADSVSYMLSYPFETRYCKV